MTVLEYIQPSIEERKRSGESWVPIELPGVLYVQAWHEARERVPDDYRAEFWPTVPGEYFAYRGIRIQPAKGSLDAFERLKDLLCPAPTTG